MTATDVIDRRGRQLAGIFPGTSVTVLDRDFRFVLAAGQAFRGAESTVEAQIGRRALEVLQPDVWAALAPHCEAALCGETRQLDLPARLDGAVLRLRIVPWWSKDGDEVERIMLVAKDKVSPALDC